MGMFGAETEGKTWVFVLGLTAIPILLVDGNYSTALPIIKAEWNLTNEQAGAIYSAFYFGFVVGSAILATATDYFPARTIFLLSGVWLVLANLLVALLAEGFWSAALLRGLAGAGLSGVYSSGVRMVADHAPPSRKAFAMSFFTFAYSFGVATSLFATGALLGYFDWRTSFAIGSAGSAAGVVWAGFVIPRRPPPQGESQVGFEFPQLPLAVWVIIGLFVLHRTEVFGFRAWVVAFFSSSLMGTGLERAAAVNDAASAAAAILIIASFANLAGGWLTDRFGHISMMVVTPILSGGVAVLLGAASGLPYPAIWAIALLWAVLMPIDAPSLIVMATEVSPRRHLGSALGLHSGLGFLLGSTSPIVMGQILDVTNPGVAESALPENWGWALAAPGLAAFVGVGGALWLARLVRNGDGRRTEARCAPGSAYVATGW